MIILEHLQMDFDGETRIKDVDLTINDGDVAAIIGPSGSGKSTLLQCINLLIYPTKGRITVNDTLITSPECNINKIRQKMGMVFQNFNLFGHLTAIENVMLAQTELMGKTRQQAYDRSMELLDTVGLSEKALSYPDELSGGQKQRIAIARTLATDPDIILFDEPTSALDHNMVSEVQAVIRELAKTGKTMLIVTHELDLVRDICNRVIYMEDGVICDDGTPEQIFDKPQDEKTRRFIHKLKVLEICIKNQKHDFLESGARIERYCEKNRMTARMSGYIQAVFEELCRQILFFVLKESDILVTVEYSLQTNKTVVTAEYNGGFFDPADTKNDISYALLKGIAESVVYEKTDGEYLNRVTVTIK